MAFWKNVMLAVMMLVFLSCTGKKAEPVEDLQKASGLEVVDTSQLLVFYSKLDDAEREIISKKRIRAIVELRLRNNAIIPTETTEMVDGRGVLGVSFWREGDAFVTTLRFYRRLNYQVGDVRYARPAEIWRSSYLGHFGLFSSKSKERDLVEKVIGDRIDVFITEYLAANPQQ